MTEKTGTTRLQKHSWERLPREKWKPLKGKMAERFPSYLDVFFFCDMCECRGHAMWDQSSGKDPPTHPEEAENMNSKEVVDAYGDCNTQMVVAVHAR